MEKHDMLTTALQYQVATTAVYEVAARAVEESSARHAVLLEERSERLKEMKTADAIVDQEIKDRANAN